MYRVDEAICKGCGDCVEACPAGAIALVDERAHIDAVRCADCGSCAAACPQGAITMITAITPAYAATISRASQPAIIPAATPREAASLAHRPEIEVMAVERPRSRLWPMIGSALVWAARELLPQVTAAWRAAHAEVSPPFGGKPTASNRRTTIGWRNGHRHRWGRT